MEKFKKSQILNLFFILAFLIITPLLPSSSRPTFLYCILNIFIVALGAQSGLLSFISTTPGDQNKAMHETKTPLDDDQSKQISKLLQKLPLKKIVGSLQVINTMKKCSSKPSLFTIGMEEIETKLLQKLPLKKIVGSLQVINTMKKCISKPSLFTIGMDEVEEKEEFVEDVFQESVGEISEEELYDKAETFIGNFYKQLKMQRERSWQNIHGVYQQSILSQ